MSSKLLNSYQAAALLCMSPELLRDLTSKQVKWKDKRRLIATEISGELFFEAKELEAYNDWLKAPWPAKDGKRPALPDCIRAEIRLEANLECALCKSSGEAAEAAHIDPVSTSKCNHPHNLIWLCASHHTKFDNGCFGPKGADNKVIAGLKLGLQHFKRMAWQGQAEIGRRIAATLSLCNAMLQNLEVSAKTKEEIEAVEQMAEKVLELLPGLASLSKGESVQPTLQHMAVALAEGKAKTTTSTRIRLATAVSYEAEFLQRSGLIQCPLCNGSKTHNGYDCPVCDGDGAVSKDLEVDIAEFEAIHCELCDGTGCHEGGECPACGGEGTLERRVSNRIDFSLYDYVVCPLCDGSRKWQGEDCSECDGEGELLRGAAERVDLNNYEQVDCPLCEGEGSYEHDTCPECHGDRMMQRRFANRVDVAKYDLRDCPLCEGSGRFFEGDCPECGGNMRMPIYAVARVDLAKYQMVECPTCYGVGSVDGDDCPVCCGQKKITRIHADRM